MQREFKAYLLVYTPFSLYLYSDSGMFGKPVWENKEMYFIIQYKLLDTVI